MQRQSTIITPPEPAPTPDVLGLVRQAYRQTRAAARVANGFENLEDVSFEDLDAIARDCHAAMLKLETAERLLAGEKGAAR